MAKEKKKGKITYTFVIPQTHQHLQNPSNTINNHFTKYLLVLENILSSYLLLSFDGFSQREKSLYFRERNLTLGHYFHWRIQHIYNMWLNWW